MTLAQDFEDFVKLLNKHQVEYMIVVGYALASKISLKIKPHLVQVRI